MPRSTATPTSTLNTIRRWWQSPMLQQVSLYLILTAIVSLVLVWRYPNNILHANFYAEDGSVFLQHVIDKGWLHAIVTPFNGYFVSGLYILEAAGSLLNSLFGHEGLLSLPAYFALVSMIFMASVVALPYPLFQRRFGKLKMLAVVACSALLPLPLAPHIVFGTIGNQKWVFMYLATLLVIYRVLNFRHLSIARTSLIDGILLLCAYTNSATYALVPLLYVPYLADYWRQRKRTKILDWLQTSARDRQLLSLIVLTVLLLPQLLYVAIRGIPTLPGYLDTPYQFSKTIEVFINRTYIFGGTHMLNGHMNNLLTVVLFGGLLGAWHWLSGQERVAYLISLYAAGVASLLFVINRPGVTDFFNNYQYSGSGPDQFFFAQTLIMYLPIVLAIYAYARIIKVRRARAGLIILALGFILVSGLISNATFGTRWRNASIYENTADTFIDQSLAACRAQTGPSIKVAVYPYPDGRFALSVPRKDICTTRLTAYQPTVDHLKLAPDNNNYVTLNAPRITQTFAASEPRLNGIRIFLSNFDKPQRRGTYYLILYDHSCKTELRRVTIPQSLMDSSEYNARFNPIPESAGQFYCFSLTIPSDSPYDPVAIQLSAPDVYAAGQLTIDRDTQTTDAVFEPLYTQASK